MKFGASLGTRDVELLQRGFVAQEIQTLDGSVLSSSKDTGITFNGKYSTPNVEGHAIVAGWDTGISARSENRDQRDKALPGIVPIVSYDDFDASIVRLAAFVQDEWNVTKDWSVYLGVRWEGLNTASEGNTYARISNRSSVWSPILQTLYKLPDRNGEQFRLALNQNQPLGNARFYARIEKATGVRREARQRGRPRLEPVEKEVVVAGQGVLKL